MAATVEHKGVTYRVVEDPLPEGDTKLMLSPPTRDPKDCPHENTTRVYARMGCYSHPLDGEPTYSPAMVVESPHGLIQVCKDCWSGKWFGDWEADFLVAGPDEEG